MRFLNEKTGTSFIIGGILIAGLSIAYFIFKHFFFNFFNSHGLVVGIDKVGDFGGFVGGIIGVVWSLAGVILFYVSIRDQKIDIKTNRDTLNTQVDALKQQVKEFELQRKELELTRAVYEEQSKTLKLQQFETTFFNLLNSQQMIIEGLVFEKKNRISNWDTEGPSARQGQVSEIKVLELAKNDFDCFYQSPENVRVGVRNLGDDTIKFLLGMEKSPPPQNMHLDRIKFKYRIFFEVYHQQLGHYFRHLFQILQFLNTTMEYDIMELGRKEGISKQYIEKEFKFYANIVQSKLSSDELFLLFYNSLCFPKMKKLIIKFNLLENLAIEDLIDERHKELYPEIKFKKRSDIIFE